MRVIAEAGRVPIKMWTDGVPVEEKAEAQLRNIASMPFIFRHVAVMPDVHLGIGATVGSVIPTQGAIIPAAVGVDIGCVDAESEYLAPDGWHRISEYAGGPVMGYDPDTNSGQFAEPLDFVRRASTRKMLRFKTKYGVDQVLSADHRVLVDRITGRKRLRVPEVVSAADLAAEHARLKLGAKVEFRTTFTPILTGGIPLTNEALRVQVMVMADAHVDARRTRHPEKRRAYLRLKKHRKIERARELLRAAGIEFKEKARDGLTLFSFTAPVATKTYADFWGASLAQLQIIADEVLNWDGTRSIGMYCTRDEMSADFIQYAFTATGKRGVKRVDRHKRDGKLDYRVFANDNSNVGLGGTPKSPVREMDSPDGYEYCFRMPTGFWVMRRGGNVVMTGNCGMVAVPLIHPPANGGGVVRAADLSDNLADFRSAIENAIPVGNGASGSYADLPPEVSEAALKLIEAPTYDVATRGIKTDRLVYQIGTLGGGNHFIEICTDETDAVWLMLHSGSRGIGNKIGQKYIELAKEDMRRHFINLPDKDLAYLSEGTEHFADYVNAVHWAQNYALANRAVMVYRVLQALGFRGEQGVVQCHHNYIGRENHFGENVWVTRKGAVDASEGKLGIIPGSMGQRSYIVRGKGNAESFRSCSHGAGRKMSRTEARRRFTVADLALQTSGVECRKDDGVVDEIPGAYKDLDAVMAAQADLVDVVHTLKAVLTVKG